MQSYNQPVLYYVHVPKTAGTTMRIIFLWLYWWNQILWAKSKAYLAEKAQNMSANDLANIRLVAGHSTFGMHEALPFTNFRYFTVLREPVSRVLSQYYYLKRQPKHRLYDVVNRYDLSLKTLLEENYLNPNVQTFWMTGAERQYFRGGYYYPEIVEMAKQNIDKYFGLVGLNEYFNQSLILLKRQMGWQGYPIYAQKNVTKSRKRQDEELPETLDAIRRYNQMDLELYNYVASQFHERLAAVNDDDFQAEVYHLQKLNQRFGSYKPYRLKVLSGFVSRSVQQFFGSYEKPDVLP